jgi:hypothetical protein
VSTKPMFPSAFKSRRCFIPASCFFECTGKPSAKVPHYFSAPAGRISETLPAPAEEEVGASAVLTIPPRSARRCFSLRQCVHCGLRRVGDSSCYSDGHEKGRQNAEGIIHRRLPARVVGRDSYARNKPCAVA